MKTKVCSRCDRTLPVTSFCTRGSGYRSECKECAEAHRRRARGLKAMVVERPIRHAWEALGAEWHDHVPYDAFNASNRYGGARPCS